jgi:integrase
MTTVDPIRNSRIVHRLAEYWLTQNNTRNALLIILGVYTGLRITDLLNLKWEDVYDEKSGTFMNHIVLIEKKTDKQKIIALNPKAQTALTTHLSSQKQRSFIFANAHTNKPISRIQAWRIIKKAALAISADGKIGCHSLRKTLGYLMYKAGVSSIMLQEIYGHASYSTTRRYLGITQDDKDEVYLNLKLN